MKHTFSLFASLFGHKQSEAISLHYLIEGIKNELLEIDNKILKIRDASDKAESSKKPLTVDEAADYLSLKPGTINNLILKGELSAIKKGKRCYITLEAINEYLAQGKQKRQEELKNIVQTFFNKQKKTK